MKRDNGTTTSASPGCSSVVLSPFSIAALRRALPPHRAPATGHLHARVVRSSCSFVFFVLCLWCAYFSSHPTLVFHFARPLAVRSSSCVVVLVSCPQCPLPEDLISPFSSPRSSLLVLRACFCGSKCRAPSTKKPCGLHVWACFVLLGLPRGTPRDPRPGVCVCLSASPK